MDGLLGAKPGQKWLPPDERARPSGLSVVGVWLRDVSLSGSPAGYTLDDLAVRVRVWCNRHGHSVPALPDFTAQLRRAGFVHRKVAVSGDGSRAWRWFAPAESA